MTVRILVGGCRVRLREFPNNFFHCVVTSWPYWGLRDYGIPPTVWGGDPQCEHVWGQEGTIHIGGQIDGTKGIRAGRSNIPAQNAVRDRATGQFCQLCGAWVGNFGLEPTPELYIQHGVEISREVRRVLREDGTMWLNLGDTYWGGKGQSGHADPGHQALRVALGESFSRVSSHVAGHGRIRPQDRRHPAIKPKDLVGIPWMAAFALRDDGWWLRSAIPWVKDNPMPESVDDRPTTAHEYLFLFSKSRRYYYDKVAIFEPVKEASVARGDRRIRLIEREGMGAGGKQQKSLTEGDGYKHAYAGLADGRSGSGVNPAGRNRRTADWWCDSLDLLIEQHRAYLLHLEHIRDQGGMLLDPDGQPVALQVNPEGFGGDHYATFPTRLVEPCLKASTSERGACPQCGAPWERVVEKGKLKAIPGQGGEGYKLPKASLAADDSRIKGRSDGWVPNHFYPKHTIGWHPTCSCYDDRYRTDFPKAHSARKRWQQDMADRWWPRVRKRPGKDDWPTVPCRVLDHMGGAGTTAMVADRLGLDAVTIDIKPEYAQMSYERLVDDAGPMFAQVTLEEEQ